jgi:hypothetical protein
MVIHIRIRAVVRDVSIVCMDYLPIAILCFTCGSRECMCFQLRNDCFASEPQHISSVLTVSASLLGFKLRFKRLDAHAAHLQAGTRPRSRVRSSLSARGADAQQPLQDAVHLLGPWHGGPANPVRDRDPLLRPTRWRTGRHADIYPGPGSLRVASAATSAFQLFAPACDPRPLMAAVELSATQPRMPC